MHIEKREDPLPDMGYEVRDINLKGIIKATIWFFVFAGISAVLGGILFWFMNPGAHKASPESMQRATLDQNVPLVQDNIRAKTDIAYLRQHEEKYLYGPPTENKDGTYTIPIGAAMQMIAKSGGKGIAAPGTSQPKNAGEAPRVADPSGEPTDLNSATTPQAGQSPTGGP